MENFNFQRDAPQSDKIIFMLGAHSLLIRVYKHICLGKNISEVFGDAFGFKLRRFVGIWEAYLDKYRSVIDQSLSKNLKHQIYNGNTKDQVNMNLVVQLLHRPIETQHNKLVQKDRIDQSSLKVWKMLGEKFVAENFMYIGELLNAMPEEKRPTEFSVDIIDSKRMLIIRKFIKAVDLIFKHEESYTIALMDSEVLNYITERLKHLFTEFVTKHKTVIDPYFQDYGPEVVRGVMNFDPENMLQNSNGKPVITPMATLLSTIRAEMFNQDRQDRLLQGPECEFLDNRVCVFRTLGELFINDHFEEIERLTLVFRHEINDLLKQTGFQTELKTESKVESERESETDSETDSLFETEPKIESQTELKVEPERESETDSETDSLFETESKVEPERELETDSETDSLFETEPKIESEKGSETEVEPEVKSETDSETDSLFGSVSKRESEKEVESVSDSETDSLFESETAL